MKCQNALLLSQMTFITCFILTCCLSFSIAKKAALFCCRYFSLQATCPLGYSDKIRFYVEHNICREEGPLPDCFRKPADIVFNVLEKVVVPAVWLFFEASSSLILQLNMCEFLSLLYWLYVNRVWKHVGYASHNVLRFVWQNFLQPFLTSELYFKYLSELINTIQASPSLLPRLRKSGTVQFSH